MKILKFDQKKGFLQVLIDRNEDFFYLNNVIEPENIVGGIAFRKIKLDNNKQIVKKAFVKLKVDHTILETERLRILGEIIEGPDDFPKANQAINTCVDDKLKLEKSFTLYDKKLINDATKIQDYNILVICFDKDDLIAYILNNRGYNEVLKLQLNSEKKDMQGSTNIPFSKQIEELLTKPGTLYYDNFQGIVFASIAFWKDVLKTRINPKIIKKSVFASISSVETGINELLKRGEIKTLLKDVEIEKHYTLISEFTKRLANDGNIAYSYNEVLGALNSGAVETVMISSNLIEKYKKEGIFNQLIEIFQLVESTKSEFYIIDSKNEVGRILDSFSGIVALTRYKMNY